MLLKWPVVRGEAGRLALWLAASELSWDRVTGGTAWPDADNIDSTDHPGRLSPAIAAPSPSPSRGGATVLKVGGTILRAERAKNFF